MEECNYEFLFHERHVNKTQLYAVHGGRKSVDHDSARDSLYLYVYTYTSVSFPYGVFQS